MINAVVINTNIVCTCSIRVRLNLFETNLWYSQIIKSRIINGARPFVIKELIEGSKVSSFGINSFNNTSAGVKISANRTVNFAALFALSE